MVHGCFSVCVRVEEATELRRSLSGHARRITIGASRAQFEFFAAQHICGPFATTRDEDDISALIGVVVDVFRGMARDVVSASTASIMANKLEAFDGLVSYVFRDESVRKLPEEAYSALFRTFGTRVLKDVLSRTDALGKIKRFNCGCMLQDHFNGWKDGIDPTVLDQLLRDSAGWSLMEKQLRRLDMFEGSPSSPRGDNSAFYDFSPVMLRTPLHVRGDADVSRVHISFFRYLVGKREFAKHVITLVNSHNDACIDPEKLNDSNVTQINNTPGRRGSVDSMASYQTAEYTSRPMNSTMELFSVHCANFFAAFGTALLLQVSNDLKNAMTDPGSDFLRLVMAMSPADASSEGLAAVQKFLSANLVASLRNLVHRRGHQSAAEDSCLSFLMKAEMSALGRRRGGIVYEYRVVSALVDSAIRLTIDQGSDKNEGKNRFLSKFFASTPSNNIRITDWLEYFLNPRASLVHAITHAPDGRKELRAIYREIAAASVAVQGSIFFWENDFSSRVNQCHRMASADFRLLFTTANGLGISPVPVATGSSNRQSPVLQTPASVTPPLPLSPVSPHTDVSEEPVPVTVDTPPLPVEPIEDAIQDAMEDEVDDGVADMVCPETEDSPVGHLMVEELVGEVAELRVRMAEMEKELFDQIDSFKEEVREMLKSRKKSPKLERDDAIKPESPDERVEAIFKKLAQGS